MLQYLRENQYRVAILHSGGPAPGSNRVLAGAAKQFLDNGVQVIGIMDGYEYIQDIPLNRIRKDVHYVDINRQTISHLMDLNAFILRTTRANPGKDIKTLDDLFDPVKNARLVHILEFFEYMKIGAFISIGGDDTLKTANYLHQLALYRIRGESNLCFKGAVVHVPKTIDNDYYGIPWTFGYFTAAERAGKELRSLFDDARATNSYHVVELMGRKAGWYTAAASIFAEGTKAIIPEDYQGREHVDLNEIARELASLAVRRNNEGKGYGIICIAEGIAEKLSDEDRKDICRDSHGHLNLAQAKLAEKLADLIEFFFFRISGVKKDFKPQIIGYQTRQTTPNLYDALLTSQLGVGAYSLIESGRYGEMVTVGNNLEIGGIPFHELIDPRTLIVRNRNIDIDGDFYKLLRSLEDSGSSDPGRGISEKKISFHDGDASNL